jgi:hypothetical protein
VHHQVVAVNAQSNRKSVFERREILIELPEQAEVIGQVAQVNGSFGC